MQYNHHPLLGEEIETLKCSDHCLECPCYEVLIHSLRYRVFLHHAVGDTSWLRTHWTKVASAMLTLNWVSVSEFLLLQSPVYNYGRYEIKLL